VLDISLLTKLNLEPNYIYETIVTTYTEDNLPNAAPMGIILLDEQTVVISPFLSTQTFKNIEKYGCAVINFLYDLKIFFESAFSTKKPKLPREAFEKAKQVNAPRLQCAIAHIELQVHEIRKDNDHAKVVGDILGFDVSSIPLLPLNRGYNLVLESIIHTTRILEFHNDPQKVKPLVALVNQYQKLVEKVAPIGDCVDLMRQLQKLIHKKGLGH
jgi:hypothetical protein